MLEMSSKWFTNTLAKKAMLTNDFITCSNNQRLYIVSYGNLTTSGKNTYNVEIKDESDVLIREESNLYLDAITKIILGSSLKAKANKETNESKEKKCVSFEQKYLQLFNKVLEAQQTFDAWKEENKITCEFDAITKDNEARAKKRNEAQAKRRNEEAIILRVNKLRKWAKESQRLDLLQNLNNKLLEM